MRRRLLDYIGITIGSLITAMGLNAFLIPNKIAAGGASGIGTILYYLFRWDPGLVMLLINIPLLILTGWLVGLRFGAYSVLGGILTSVFTTATAFLPTVTRDPLLACVYGGLVTGIGMGLVFKFKGSTGGTDLLAKLISHYSGVPVGQSLLVIDAAVVIAAGFLFTSEFALYALLTIIITTQVIDIVQEGRLLHAKALFIISDHNETIAKGLMTELERGVTVLESQGAYTGVRRGTILCVVSRSELARAKAVIHQTDAHAFVIVTDVREALGEGFKQLTLED
jgi:uncharacterized membrane-anchored protein YitT (DUF2179 family)